MMKVYDMVTSGFYEPDETGSSAGNEMAEVWKSTPALQLQTLQTDLTTPAPSFPPSLRDVDIDCFLDGISG